MNIKKRKIIKKTAPFVFLLPFFLLSLVFTFIPMIYSFFISFQKMSFLNLSKSKFVALDNYKKVLEDEVFLKAIVNNLKLILIVVPILIAVSLLLAVLLNSKMKCRGFFRSAFYLPYVVTPIAIGVISVQLFSKNGMLVNFLENFGIEPISWHTAMPYAIWLVVIVIIWTQMGFFMMLYLNGLSAIPKDYYEAARIDGAGKIQQFWYITKPQLNATTYLVLFMCFLSIFQIFDQPYVISTTGGATAGSPGDGTLTMVMYIYNMAFRYREMGQASAAAFIVFLIIFMTSLIQSIVSEKKKKANGII